MTNNYTCGRRNRTTLTAINRYELGSLILCRVISANCLCFQVDRKLFAVDMNQLADEGNPASDLICKKKLFSRFFVAQLTFSK